MYFYNQWAYFACVLFTFLLSPFKFSFFNFISLFFPRKFIMSLTFLYIYNLGEFEAEAFPLDKWPPWAEWDDMDGAGDDDVEGGLRFCFNWFFRRGRESCWPGKREGWCCWKTSLCWCSFSGITDVWFEDDEDAVWWCFCITHVHEVFYKDIEKGYYTGLLSLSLSLAK